MVLIECLAKEIFDDPRFSELCREQALEVGVPGYVEGYVVQRGMYDALEEACKARFFAVRGDDDSLWGFGVVILSVSMHYGKTLAYADTFFVEKSKRKTGAGLRLLRAMRDCAEECGAPYLVVNAQSGTPLDAMLSAMSERGKAKHAYNSYLLESGS